MGKGTMYCPYCRCATKVYTEIVENKVLTVCSICDRTIQVDIYNKCDDCEYMEERYENDLYPNLYCKKLNKYIIGCNNDFWCK